MKSYCYRFRYTNSKYDFALVYVLILQCFNRAEDYKYY